jgi:hypothetical protein
MKDDRTYLLHIRDAIAQIQDYSKDGPPGKGRIAPENLRPTDATP